MFESGEGFDWATGEALAFGSLVAEGHDVRLSGQDSGRGTFSQRHAVWVDQKDGEKYIPLRTISGGRFEVRDSPLVRIRRARLRIWLFARRPQHAGAVGSAVRRFRQRRAERSSTSSSPAGEAKWLRASGLVMLLPHGFEGQGPEHSSARLERYLQLCAEDNIQVANCTTPANYFHILRRQMLRDFRKPLVMMTPKSLLRHKLAVSTLADFIGDSHFQRIVSDLRPPAEGETRRLVLCSGKVAYELMEARDAAGDARHRDHPHRAALSLPVGAAGQAAEGDAQARGAGLGAGRAEEQRRLVLRRAAAREVPRRRRPRRDAPALCRPRAVGLARDRPRQAPRGRAGRAHRRRARPTKRLRRTSGRPRRE